MATPSDNSAPPRPGPRGRIRRRVGRAVVVLLLAVIVVSAVGWVRSRTREDAVVFRHQRRHDDGAATFYTAVLASSEGRVLLLAVSDRVTRPDDAALSLAATTPAFQLTTSDTPVFGRPPFVLQSTPVVDAPGVEIRTDALTLPRLSLIRQFHLGLRWWVPIAVAGAPLAGWALVRLRARRKRRPGMCPQCGYDLRASPDRCPECGNPPARRSPFAVR